MIGSPETSLDDAHALTPHGGYSARAGSGPRSRSTTIAGSRPACQRAEQRVADQRAAHDAGVLDALLEGGDRDLAVLVAGAGRVAHLDDLVVVHELARPLDDADAQREHRDAHGHAERDVGGTEAEHRVGVARRSRRRSRRRTNRTTHSCDSPNSPATCARRASRPSGRRRSAGGGVREGRDRRSGRPASRARRSRAGRGCRRSRLGSLLLGRTRAVGGDPDGGSDAGARCRRARRTCPRRPGRRSRA